MEAKFLYFGALDPIFCNESGQLPSEFAEKGNLSGGSFQTLSMGANSWIEGWVDVSSSYSNGIRLENLAQQLPGSSDANRH
jgi:hypothetical protein